MDVAVRYYSKKDIWLVVLVAAAVLLPFAQTIYELFSGDMRALGSLLLEAAVLGILLLLGYPLYYELTPSALKVRCGILIDKQIPLSAVQEVVPTRNPLSAPAWSLERLRVNYKVEGSESFMLISPEDKTGFMDEFAKRDAGLEVQSGRVVRLK